VLLTQAAPAGDTFTIIDARDGGLGVERDNAVEAFYDGEAVNKLANKQIRAQTWDKKIYVTVKNQTNQAFWIDWVNYDGFQHN
jgi:proline racemase